MDAQITQVVLKKHKDANGNPLILSQADTTRMTLLIIDKDKKYTTANILFDIKKEGNIPIPNEHLSKKNHSKLQSTNNRDIENNLKGDEYKVTLSAKLTQDSLQEIQYIFTLPKKGYKLDCQVKLKGFPSTEAVHIVWYKKLGSVEKDIEMDKRSSSLYYHEKKKLHSLNLPLKKEEIKQIDAVDWVSVSNRFFSQALIISKDTPFENAEIIFTPPTDKKDTKQWGAVGIRAEIPSKALEGEGTTFSFYFGPNQYKDLKAIAPGFGNNHYLGITFFKHINRYIILPIFTQLQRSLAPYQDALGDYLLILILLLFALLFKLLQGYFAYRSYIVNIRKKVLQPEVRALKEKYKDDKNKLQMEEMNLYKKWGANPMSLMSILGGFLQLPIFFSMMQFINNNIAFRNAGFLWAKDLSSYDDLIHFSFHIPWLGSHISIFALIMSFLPLVSSKLDKASTQPEQKVIAYIMPLIMFLVFNSYPVAFCIYRILSILVDLILSLIFRLTINESAHIATMKIQMQHKTEEKTIKPPRAIARLKKKKKK